MKKGYEKFFVIALIIIAVAVVAFAFYSKNVPLNAPQVQKPLPIGGTPGVPACDSEKMFSCVVNCQNSFELEIINCSKIDNDYYKDSCVTTAHNNAYTCKDGCIAHSNCGELEGACCDYDLSYGGSKNCVGDVTNTPFNCYFADGYSRWTFGQTCDKTVCESKYSCSDKFPGSATGASCDSCIANLPDEVKDQVWCSVRDYFGRYCCGFT
jgi:hypothetical protein